MKVAYRTFTTIPLQGEVFVNDEAWISADPTKTYHHAESSPRLVPPGNVKISTLLPENVMSTITNNN